MDAQLQKLVKAEVKRQGETIDLIPSENLAAPEMMRLVGSPLMNKYSEGYVDKRYYPSNEFYDKIEQLAQDRGLAAFGVSQKQWAVNVQPYSGSPANLAVYFALLKPGDTVMGLSLSHGGHLTHGHKVNFSGMLYTSVPYGLDAATGGIDHVLLAQRAREHKPKLIVSGATAYSRVIDFKKIGAIAKEVGAYHLADISHIAGLVAAGVHPSPFPYADLVTMTTHKTLRGPRGAVIFSRREPVKMPGHIMAPSGKELLMNEAIDKAVFPGLQGGPHNNTTAAIAWMFGQVKTPAFKKYAVQIVKNAQALADELNKLGFRIVSGGTDNHLMLVDLTGTGIDGSKAQDLLEASGISANRNTIPGDASPFRPSGIRLGTPAVTSRGMKEKEMKQIAQLISRSLREQVNVLADVKKLCKRFPLPY